MTTTVHVENLLYGGRALVGFTEEGERVAGWAEVAYESIRAINHLTSHCPIPAPTAYRILGDLKGVGHLLPQALEQLARGLQASLEAFDVYDHRGHPGESVAEAIGLLCRAARKAADLGQLLEDAQAAISEQGYRQFDETTPELPGEW
ncbi:hypothetical protein [Propioniciclava tarda]|uniref:hypothetical protein n=1 Tax=Propioniciclava tarda TaxID=433330 RepID=UPI00116C4C64|nr:hypothetical protein [Propioniciclava tarda]SMO41367.1 hypothetical protein SAMN06266982_102169 [Propioniciclava tarda]